MTAKGSEVAKFRSEHEGRGRFSLTPQAGEKYTLKITRAERHQVDLSDLPAVKADGVAISTSSNVFGEKVQIQLASPNGAKSFAHAEQARKAAREEGNHARRR